MKKIFYFAMWALSSFVVSDATAQLSDQERCALKYVFLNTLMQDLQKKDSKIVDFCQNRENVSNNFREKTSHEVELAKESLNLALELSLEIVKLCTTKLPPLTEDLTKQVSQRIQAALIDPRAAFLRLPLENNDKKHSYKRSRNSPRKIKIKGIVQEPFAQNINTPNNDDPPHWIKDALNNLKEASPFWKTITGLTSPDLSFQKKEWNNTIIEIQDIIIKSKDRKSLLNNIKQERTNNLKEAKNLFRNMDPGTDTTKIEDFLQKVKNSYNNMLQKTIDLIAKENKIDFFFTEDPPNTKKVQNKLTQLIPDPFSYAFLPEAIDNTDQCIVVGIKFPPSSSYSRENAKYKIGQKILNLKKEEQLSLDEINEVEDLFFSTKEFINAKTPIKLPHITLEKKGPPIPSISGIQKTPSQIIFPPAPTQKYVEKKAKKYLTNFPSLNSDLPQNTIFQTHMNTALMNTVPIYPEKTKNPDSDHEPFPQIINDNEQDKEQSNDVILLENEQLLCPKNFQTYQPQSLLSAQKSELQNKKNSINIEQNKSFWTQKSEKNTLPTHKTPTESTDDIPIPGKQMGVPMIGTDYIKKKIDAQKSVWKKPKNKTVQSDKTVKSVNKSQKGTQQSNPSDGNKALSRHEKKLLSENFSREWATLKGPLENTYLPMRRKIIKKIENKFSNKTTQPISVDIKSIHKPIMNNEIENKFSQKEHEKRSNKKKKKSQHTIIDIELIIIDTESISVDMENIHKPIMNNEIENKFSQKEPEKRSNKKKKKSQLIIIDTESISKNIEPIIIDTEPDTESISVDIENIHKPIMKLRDDYSSILKNKNLEEENDEIKWIIKDQNLEDEKLLFKIARNILDEVPHGQSSTKKWKNDIKQVLSKSALTSKELKKYIKIIYDESKNYNKSVEYANPLSNHDPFFYLATEDIGDLKEHLKELKKHMKNFPPEQQFAFHSALIKSALLLAEQESAPPISTQEKFKLQSRLAVLSAISPIREALNIPDKQFRDNLFLSIPRAQLQHLKNLKKSQTKKDPTKIMTLRDHTKKSNNSKDLIMNNTEQSKTSTSNLKKTTKKSETKEEPTKPMEPRYDSLSILQDQAEKLNNNKNLIINNNKWSEISVSSLNNFIVAQRMMVTSANILLQLMGPRSTPKITDEETKQQIKQQAKDMENKTKQEQDELFSLQQIKISKDKMKKKNDRKEEKMAKEILGDWAVNRLATKIKAAKVTLENELILCQRAYNEKKEMGKKLSDEQYTTSYPESILRSIAKTSDSCVEKKFNKATVGIQSQNSNEKIKLGAFQECQIGSETIGAPHIFKERNALRLSETSSHQNRSNKDTEKREEHNMLRNTQNTEATDDGLAEIKRYLLRRKNKETQKEE